VCARGFTLLEVSIVVVISAIIAVSFAPAIASLESARGASAAEMLAQKLTLARHAAEASGTPAGVRVDPDLDTIEVVELDEAGSPRSRRNVLGAAGAPVDLSERFGIGISSFTGPDGSAFVGTVWFGYDGSPEVRDADGALVSAATSDSEIELGSPAEWRITVRRVSGLITREQP